MVQLRLSEMCTPRNLLFFSASTVEPLRLSGMWQEPHKFF